MKNNRQVIDNSDGRNRQVDPILGSLEPSGIAGLGAANRQTERRVDIPVHLETEPASRPPALREILEKIGV